MRGSEAVHTPVLVIEPKKGLRWIDLGELWNYRELLGFLIWRDVGVRYRQSLLGAGWAILQPLLTMIIFTIIFGRLAKIPSDGIPYPIFSYCALLPWTYFTRSIIATSDSVVGKTDLISKVYFPRMLLPLSGVLVGWVDFIIAFSILVLMMFWYGVAPAYGVLLLPLFMLMTMLTALGTGLWLTALNVKYRDIKFVVPFLTQLWMYGSPIVYSTTIIPEKWRSLYALNPMAGVIEGFRWALLGKPAPDWTMAAISLVVILILVLSGICYFRKMERTFADII